MQIIDKFREIDIQKHLRSAFIIIPNLEYDRHNYERFIKEFNDLIKTASSLKKKFFYSFIMNVLTDAEAIIKLNYLNNHNPALYQKMKDYFNNNIHMFLNHTYNLHKTLIEMDFLNKELWLANCTNYIDYAMDEEDNNYLEFSVDTVIEVIDNAEFGNNNQIYMSGILLLNSLLKNKGKLEQEKMNNILDITLYYYALYIESDVQTEEEDQILGIIDENDFLIHQLITLGANTRTPETLSQHLYSYLTEENEPDVELLRKYISAGVDLDKVIIKGHNQETCREILKNKLPNLSNIDSSPRSIFSR